jgi:3-polyprenyl-4-hydroxybenzoate decarboxylase
MAALEAAAEMRRIKAPVDCDREIGAIARLVLERNG